LIFLGSKNYPYKSLLGSVARRSYSPNLNAYTENDHTVYTVESAGSEGFLKTLVPYLECILYPRLSHASFVTEVHHIRETGGEKMGKAGAGENAGVVYCEMQGKENSMARLTLIERRRALYPEGSAYRSESGGLTQALRDLTIDESTFFTTPFLRIEVSHHLLWI
jgi:Zn-dependent M16 (insulinase) family peptidase